MRRAIVGAIGAFVTIGGVWALDPPGISPAETSKPAPAETRPTHCSPAVPLLVPAVSDVTHAQLRVEPLQVLAESPISRVQGRSDQPVAPTAPLTSPVTVQSSGLPEGTYSERDQSSPFWFGAEYLLWGVKGAPIPVPLVTTGDPKVGFPAVNSAGGIGQPGTSVLFGNSNARFNALSGMRFTLGGWVGADRTWGIEGSGFVTQRQSNQFFASSDANGNPALYFPAFNVSAGEERGLPISDPLRLYAGDVSITNTLQLGGYEVNALFSAFRRPGFDAAIVAGFRYVQLREQLLIHNATTDLLLLNNTVSDDLFQTQNQFYGGQVGARFGWNRERLSLSIAGKIAMGGTRQTSVVAGTTTQTALPGGFAPTPGTFNSGIYAQTSNIGQRSTDVFSVIPTLEAKLGIQITPRIRGTVGYDFMYWSNVARPGGLIDHSVNQTQSPVFGLGSLVGPAYPAPKSDYSDFWTQGVSFGLLWAY